MRTNGKVTYLSLEVWWITNDIENGNRFWKIAKASPHRTVAVIWILGLLARLGHELKENDAMDWVLHSGKRCSLPLSVAPPLLLRSRLRRSRATWRLLEREDLGNPAPEHCVLTKFWGHGLNQITKESCVSSSWGGGRLGGWGGNVLMHMNTQCF